MGGKKKRLDTMSLRSSSARHDSVSPATTARQTTSHVSVGCMSGIFQFVSNKYHTRRKFLTFGKKQEREAPSTSPKQKPPKPENATCQTHDQNSSSRLSLEVPRSPAIPAEIRKPPPSDFAASPRVVERLMGLDNISAALPAPAATVESAAEKRRKLLGALERCDEDLQTLKRIIKEVRAGHTPPPTPPHVVHAGGLKEEEEGEDYVGSEEPSPVSVLDHHQLLTRSSPPSYSKRTREGQMLYQQQQQTHKQQQQQQRQNTARKKPGEEDKASFSFQNNRQYASSVLVVTTPPQSATTSPWSRAMSETVVEVCRDVERGQTREVGGVGLLIQDLIVRDLIEEIIKDLSCLHVCSTTSFCSLPYEACKRKLCF